MMKGANPFELFNLPPNASLEEAKRAYKQLVRIWHPDQFADRPGVQAKAQEKLKEINVAYREITRMIKEGDDRKTEATSAFHDLAPHQTKHPSGIPELTLNSLMARFKKNFGRLRRFFTGNNLIAGEHRNGPYPAKGRGVRKRGGGKNQFSNFEQVLQQSLEKRFGVSKSSPKKTRSVGRMNPAGKKHKASPLRARGISSRSSYRSNDRIEKIRPIEKIKGIGKIK